MFDDKDILISDLRHPLSIASRALTEIENRLGGTKVIADPNSPFCQLLEFGSSIASSTIQAMDNKLEALYAVRAMDMEDLYTYMSDYDYLQLYSTPAQTHMTLSIPKKYLKDNALSVDNAAYKKITLPKDSVFTVGKYPFGIFYPIDILINTNTDTFTTSYDTTETNPLHTLEKNYVDKYDFTYSGVEYLAIDFPIYQFSKSVKEEALIAETGFAKKYTYNNKFFAVRIFSYLDGVYTELSQALSENVYDLTKVTAVVKIYQDTHTVRITIPQVYFDNNMLGSKLYIEFYTTLGSMNVNTTNIGSNSIIANFGSKSKDSTSYSAPFKTLPFDKVLRLSADSIAGGTDPISLSELRERIVNRTLYDRVPITETDIFNLLKDEGFSTKKYLDNVTDRTYNAYKALKTEDGTIIPSVTGKTRLVASEFSQISSFRQQSDNSVTILPTTMYKYNGDINSMDPINDEVMTSIINMDKTELVEELNTNQYFRSPFHIRMNFSDYYPEAISYNLMSPTIEKTIFETENYSVSSKMSIFTSTIEHLNSGVDGYDLNMIVYLSDDLVTLDKSDIKVYISVKNNNGIWIGGEAIYVSDYNNQSTRAIYKLHIDTNYHLTENDEIGITNLTAESLSLSEYQIPLTSDFYVVFMVNKDHLEEGYQNATSKVTLGVPTTYLENYVGIGRQYLTIKLGYSLSDVIQNNVEVSSTSNQYATWDHDVLAYYEEEVYARDDENNLVYTEDENGALQLVVLAKVGDPKLDTAGNQVYLHRKGDLRYDFDGNPIVDVTREKVYYVESTLIDVKVFASERTAELSFVDALYSTLETYFTQIRTIQDTLLERTHMFFKCVRSTGTAKFNKGDGIIVTDDIELSFKLRCYVPSYVKQSTDIQAIITEQVCSAIESAIQAKTISMLDIFESVKEQLTDYIDHFTILGINGDITNQTFSIVDEDAQPSIARKLTLSEDNVISLDKQIDIEYVALENNRSSILSVAIE